MTNIDFVNKFWQDFYIPFQEQVEDFPIANTSDAVKGLIRARNWMGKLTENLITVSSRTELLDKELKVISNTINSIEMDILAKYRYELPASYLKSKDTLKIFARSKMDNAETKNIVYLEGQAKIIEDQMTSLYTEKNTLEKMLRLLEKTTEWLIQYINWQKFELRSLNA